MNNRSQHRKGRRLLAVLASPGLIACLCISALTHGVSLAAADDSAKPADSEVPQASYAGQDACLECHDDVGESFSEAVHGRVELPGWAGNDGCESCHGPLAVHAETGEPDDVTSFAEMSAVDANEACLTCHGSNAGMYWRGSRHETVDVRCTQCHAVHGSWTLDKALANRNVTENCLTCHTEQQKSMFQRSNHPLRNGQMSCADCHNPHGSPIEANIAALSVNDKCYECHSETRGPFLWDHIPVREDCMTCHTPHGSNQTKLLVQTPPRLCQSCHLFGHHQTVPGTPRQVWNANRSCVNCHARIHGSNHPSGILFMR